MTLTHKENISFSIPGKAFLAGEYLALKGGPALTAAVGPRFRLDVKSATSENLKNPFHANSPAGKFWNQNQTFFKNYEVHFVDSHNGMGGWGGSTAEFALLYSFYDWAQNLREDFNEEENDFDLKKMLNDYQNFSDGGGVFRPSGADLIGQMSGELTYFDRELGKVESFAWPFSDSENAIGFILARSGVKLSTHEHLKELKEFSSENLARQMDKVYSGLSKRNSEYFLEGVRGYAVELERLNFVAPQTLKILRQLESPIILAKKGCGALGADVVCVFFNEKNRSQVMELLDRAGLEPVASNLVLETGIKGDLL